MRTTARCSGRWARGVWTPFLVLLCLLCGCHDESALTLTDWRFERDGGTGADIRLPTRVDDLLGTRGGSYTITKRVRLPASMRGVALTLAFPRLPSLARLEVSGRPLESAIAERLVGYRNPDAHQWRIPADLTRGPELTLRVVVLDRWFQSGWLGSTPHLSTHKDGDRWYRFVSSFNSATALTTIAVILVLGMSYLIVYFGDRRRVAYGWFAAQALFAGSYPLLTLGVTQLVLGTHDLRSLSLVAVAAAISISYTHAHFRIAPPHRGWLWLGALNVLAALTVGGPFSARYGLAPVVVLTVAVSAIYQLTICTRLLITSSRRGDALTLLLSWLFLGLLAGPDLVYWLGLGGWLEGLHGGSLGIMAFGLLQAVALSREHERAMASTDKLNAELALRVQSLEVRDQENTRLADELRRQVAARSRQLSHALARLGRGSDATSELSPGTIIDDRYRVLSRLGDGGMAVVFEVERLEDSARLALKLLRSTSDAQTMARFAREAHIAAEISHPNLVAIHDIDFASGGFMYVVMDLVRGKSLREYATRYGDVRFGLRVLKQAALGLSALHQRGVVHRDFKPDNVLLEEQGTTLTVRISDFGIASPSVAGRESAAPRAEPVQGDATRPLTVVAEALPWRQADDVTQPVATHVNVPGPPLLLDAPRLSIQPQALLDITSPTVARGAPHLTQAGQLLGTPAYMAPELASDESRSSLTSRDVFSFGVVAYEVLAGTRPYPRPPVFSRIQQESIPPPSPLTLRDSVAPELIRLIERAIAVEPAQRPTMNELLTALERACPDLGDGVESSVSPP